ncbi:aminotransferase class I/II-fold pyridoxal phosphate-dependent enzyme [Pseudoxanthomonas helianthi]|uniref:Aminotransferase class I/II-fold pyridoxal phosphate-dependent enzyme n=1 Tax=Pseudoxanthomonas helianthi TaxID=1453541 RepID=A0A940WYZ3_9GAMM|nr:aminotransferase class I/II-fold pyridoxal phosphate-dependent enzyme [Pseudoxanthomonas helianthi]MBP3983285.1 aminotransferase class I/II-fold pyridoxal phosphate-dependent enzyme [Pseudoxanthomonas helianthi]
MQERVEPFRAFAISQLARALESQGRSVIHMEFGQPSTPAPARALAAVRDALDRDPPGYWESLPLRQRIAHHYRERHGVDVDPARVVLTCGASPALLLALLTRFQVGERIAFARPGYVAYRNTARAAHLRPVEIGCGPESRYQLTAAALAALDPAPAGVILASPANPTGTIIAPEELQAIVRVCRERGTAIVSDEIYHGLHYGEAAHSILEYAPEAFVVNSFSKYYSMVDWRLGWLLVPEAYVDTVRAYAGNLFLTPPSPSQQAALVAMDCDDELEGHRQVYARNRALLLEALPSMGLQRIAPPDGAFYIWADVGHLTDDSLAFCMRLAQETGVALAPGIDFDPVDGHRFIRFSFAPGTGQVEEALRRLRPWFAAQPSIR